MKFLVDTCAGRLVTEWLRTQGHDVVLVHERGPDPGDQAILKWAFDEGRILITMDKDYGTLIYRDRLQHAGVIRLPHSTPAERKKMLATVIGRYGEALAGSVIVLHGDRIRLAPRMEPD